MSSTYGGRSNIPPSGYGPNGMLYRTQPNEPGYSGVSAGHSYAPPASYTYYVRPRVGNPETRCSRLGRTVLLCSTFVTAVCAIIMFYLSAATSNLDYLIILSLCLLLIQAGTGIFVSFTKNKWILFLFSFYCLLNGLAVGTVLAFKGPYHIPSSDGPPLAPSQPPMATSPSPSGLPPVATSPGKITTSKFSTYKLTSSTSTTKRSRWTNFVEEEETPDDDYDFDSRQSREKTRQTTLAKTPTNVTTITKPPDTNKTTTTTTTTTTLISTTVAAPHEPKKKMAIVYVVMWFSVANDLVMSFVAYTLICSIGADPDRQLFSESEISGSSSSTSSGGAQRSRPLSVRARQVVSPQLMSGSVVGASGSQQRQQQQQQSSNRTGRSGMRSYSPSGRRPPQTGSQVTAATRSVSGRSGASGSQATVMQNRSFLSGASQASSSASRATGGASLLSARRRPQPFNAYR